MRNKILGAVFFLLCLWAGFVWAREGHEDLTESRLEAVRSIVSQVPLGFEGVKEMLTVHPLFVHFPIAFLLGSFLFYLCGRILGNEGFLAAGKWSLFLGTLSGAFTVWTGLQAASIVSHGGEVHPILMMHQYFGIGVLTLSIILSGWVLISKSLIPKKGQAIFFSLLVLLAVLVLQGVDFGGRMVYLQGVGVGRKSMMEKPAVSEGHHHETHTH